MSHNPTAADEAFERRKSAIGVRMTLLYLIVYGGFVVVSVFQPQWMGVRAVLGLNLAVAYGLFLIIIAVVFALVYNHLCRIPTAGAESGAGRGSVGAPGVSGAAGPRPGPDPSGKEG